MAGDVPAMMVMVMAGDDDDDGGATVSRLYNELAHSRSDEEMLNREQLGSCSCCILIATLFTLV